MDNVKKEDAFFWGHFFSVFLDLPRDIHHHHHHHPLGARSDASLSSLVHYVFNGQTDRWMDRWQQQRQTFAIIGAYPTPSEQPNYVIDSEKIKFKCDIRSFIFRFKQTF